MLFRKGNSLFRLGDFQVRKLFVDHRVLITMKNPMKNHIKPPFFYGFPMVFKWFSYVKLPRGTSFPPEFCEDSAPRTRSASTWPTTSVLSGEPDSRRCGRGIQTIKISYIYVYIYIHRDSIGILIYVYMYISRSLFFCASKPDYQKCSWNSFLTFVWLVVYPL